MSFLRVKDIEIGYTLPKSWVRQIGLSDIRLYAKGSNLFTFSKFDLWDPEVDTSVGTKYPIMKSHFQQVLILISKNKKIKK